MERISLLKIMGNIEILERLFNQISHKIKKTED